MFQIAAADRADKMSIRVDEHLAAHMPRRGAFTARHRTQRSGFIILFNFRKGLVNGFHVLFTGLLAVGVALILREFYPISFASTRTRIASTKI